MKKRKVTSKQERNDLVRSFLNSGQTKTLWCKEHGIPLPTFYKWLKAYHGAAKEVSFVALKSKQAKTVQPRQQSIAPNESIIIEVGACKIHIPKQMDVSFIAQLIQEVNASNV